MKTPKVTTKDIRSLVDALGRAKGDFGPYGGCLAYCPHHDEIHPINDECFEHQLGKEINKDLLSS